MRFITNLSASNLQKTFTKHSFTMSFLSGKKRTPWLVALRDAFARAITSESREQNSREQNTVTQRRRHVVRFGNAITQIGWLSA
jgi:hypothetical protein